MIGIGYSHCYDSMYNDFVVAIPRSLGDDRSNVL